MMQKRFNDTLVGVNNTILDLIYAQTKEFENNEQIIDWKNQLQKSRFTYLGYKDFPEIKAAFYQRLARKIVLDKIRQT